MRNIHFVLVLLLFSFGLGLFKRDSVKPFQIKFDTSNLALNQKLKDKLTQEFNSIENFLSSFLSTNKINTLINLAPSLSNSTIADCPNSKIVYKTNFSNFVNKNEINILFLVVTSTYPNIMNRYEFEIYQVTCNGRIYQYQIMIMNLINLQKNFKYLLETDKGRNEFKWLIIRNIFINNIMKDIQYMSMEDIYSTQINEGYYYCVFDINRKYLRLNYDFNITVNPPNNELRELVSL